MAAARAWPRGFHHSPLALGCCLRLVSSLPVSICLIIVPHFSRLSISFARVPCKIVCFRQLFTFGLRRRQFGAGRICQRTQSLWIVQIFHQRRLAAINPLLYVFSRRKIANESISNGNSIVNRISGLWNTSSMFPSSSTTPLARKRYGALPGCISSSSSPA